MSAASGARARLTNRHCPVKSCLPIVDWLSNGVDSLIHWRVPVKRVVILCDRMARLIYSFTIDWLPELTFHILHMSNCHRMGPSN